MKNFIIVLSLFICSLLRCDLATAEEQDNFKEVYAKIDRLSFEEFADWPEMKIPDYRFANVYEALVAPARPSEFCRGLLEWTGKDAATAAMLHDVIGQLNPEETARLALSALRWASLRPALAIVSLATKRFPKDYRLGYLHTKLLEECGEFTSAIEAHLRLLQLHDELPPPPNLEPRTGEYPTWMALRPEPLEKLGGPDTPLSFWLGVKLGYNNALTSDSDREMGSGRNIAHFIVPPNLESLRAACMSRMAIMLQDLTTAERTKVQNRLTQVRPTLGAYFPMFQPDLFRPDWPWLIKRLKTHPDERRLILSFATQRFYPDGHKPEVELTVPNETRSVGSPPTSIVREALQQLATTSPTVLLDDHARRWSYAPMRPEALFCLEFLETTAPRAELAAMLPGGYSDLPTTLPPESLALIPRIDAMLAKWIEALPNASQRVREDMITCRLECLSKLSDQTQFKTLAAQHPTVSTYDGEKPRHELAQAPLKLPIPAPSEALQAGQSMVELLLPSNRYRQFDHVMIEANVRLGVALGSWERFICRDRKLLRRLLSLRRPQTALEMARVAEAFGLIGEDAKATALFERSIRLQLSHRRIRFRAGTHFLGHDTARAEALLKIFPAPAVSSACYEATFHFLEEQFQNAPAILKIATVYLKTLHSPKEPDFRELLAIFYCLNSEPSHEDEPLAALDTFPDDSAPPAPPAPKPSIWSAEGGLTKSQRKLHEELCDQFLAYFRSMPNNSIGYLEISWVDIAATIYKRRGSPGDKLASDCVRFLRQYMGSNQIAPAWSSSEFPGPYRIIFDAWMKDPEKLRAKYIDVFKTLPNTNKLPMIFEQERRLRTCNEKNFPTEVINYYNSHPEIKERPEFITEMARARGIIDDADPFAATPIPDYLIPPSREPKSP